MTINNLITILQNLPADVRDLPVFIHDDDSAYLMPIGNIAQYGDEVAIRAEDYGDDRTRSARGARVVLWESRAA